jgi:hypothetical protein
MPAVLVFAWIPILLSAAIAAGARYFVRRPPGGASLDDVVQDAIDAIDALAAGIGAVIAILATWLVYFAVFAFVK